MEDGFGSAGKVASRLNLKRGLYATAFVLRIVMILRPVKIDAVQAAVQWLLLRTLSLIAVQVVEGIENRAFRELDDINDPVYIEVGSCDVLS